MVGDWVTSELAQSERVFHNMESEVCSLKEANSELIRAQEQRNEFERRLVQLEAQNVAANAMIEQFEVRRTQDQVVIHQLQIDFAAARAAAETQDQLATRIQTWVMQSPCLAPQRLATDAP